MSKFDDIISNPGNLPHRFSADSVEFEFLTLSREQVSEASFLRDDVLDGACPGNRRASKNWLRRAV